MGHASIRDPDGRCWTKAAGWGLEEIDAEKVALVSPDGDVVGGSGPRHIEYPIHTEIMAARPDVGSVVHTHSPAANEFAALDVPLRPLDHAGSLFCYPDSPRFTLTGGLIKSPSLGAALADALGGARACLMPQHGIVAVGRDAPTAVMTAMLLDRACRTQLTAMAAGPLALAARRTPWPSAPTSGRTARSRRAGSTCSAGRRGGRVGYDSGSVWFGICWRVASMRSRARCARLRVRDR